MNILVIDAQGGGIGKQIVSALKKRYPEQYITAVGTNSLATSAMLKAGADVAATGENPVIVCSRKADVIIGPVGSRQPWRWPWARVRLSVFWFR